MTLNKFNFLSQYMKQQIVEFFFKLGFNSFDVDKKYREVHSTTIQTNYKNQYQIQFLMNITMHWDGVCVAFSSERAAFFYQLLKEKKIDWNLFFTTKINRLDSNYHRPIHNSQKQLVVDFFKESESPIATRTRIAICLLTVTGIRIGELLSFKVG